MYLKSSKNRESMKDRELIIEDNWWWVGVNIGEMRNDKVRKGNKY